MKKRILFLITLNFIFFNFAANKDELTEKNDKAYQEYLELCAKALEISGQVLENFLLPELVKIVHGYQHHCIDYKQWQENNRLFFVFVKTNNYRKLRELLEEVNINAKDNDGNTALMWAAIIGNKEIAELLIKKGADVNVKDYDGRTELILAATYGHKEIVEKLINAGADVNARDKEGRTALMWAAIRGNKEIAELLINKGADVNAKDEDGRTALILAATYGHKEIVQILIDAGSDVNAENIDGKTALILANSRGHNEIVDILKKAGAKS